MICVWCGNKLKSTDTACPKCGRETPLLSDCGGFYKLRCSDEKVLSTDKVSGEPMSIVLKRMDCQRKITVITGILIIMLLVALLIGQIAVFQQVSKLEREVDSNYALLAGLIESDMKENLDNISTTPQEELSKEINEENCADEHIESFNQICETTVTAEEMLADD